MAVIDLYTRRVLGPREIEERASYQPQALGEDWSFADDMLDHDLARLLDDTPKPKNTPKQQRKDEPESAVERYARWMAIGHQQHENAQHAFRPDHRHDAPINNPSKSPGQSISGSSSGKPTDQRTRPSAEVRAEREKLFRDIERARLSQTADDLRGAAQRLRDLAQSLRNTRDKLYQHNQSHDRDLRS